VTLKNIRSNKTHFQIYLGTLGQETATVNAMLALIVRLCRLFKGQEMVKVKSISIAV